MSRATTFPPFMGQPMVKLAPGVHGIIRCESDDTLVIVMVVAEREGAGDVGRYLDSLPRNRRIIVEACISRRLAGMLERRGFSWTRTATFDPGTREWVDGYVRVGVLPHQPETTP